MAELIPVNIVIADRNYRIKTSPEDEEIIRKTTKTINDKIIEYKTQFAGRDMQDYIAMVIIWYATLAAAETGKNIPGDELSESLHKLEHLIDKTG